MNLIEILTNELCIQKKQLQDYALTAPYRYKIYSIPKRNGKGKRIIAHPSKQLKFIQRIIVKKLENILTIHEATYSYRKKINIRENAKKHMRSDYLLKMDFKDFFNKITPALFFKILERKNIPFNSDDRVLIENLLFYKKRNHHLQLSIGAPSSPLISNFIMYYFDKRISQLCNERNIIYSRYADDITFSSNKKHILFSIPGLVKKTLKDEGYDSIFINDEKTIFSSKALNRHITGITISNDETLSIGRNKKRILSSLIHKFSIDNLTESEIKSLQGKLSFAIHIEPTLYSRYQKKYGKHIMEKLISIKN